MNANLVDVLIVEDNPDDAELTIRELKKHTKAAKFFHVRDGEEAIQFIFGTGKYESKRDTSSPPGIVLLDIKMPKMDGIEFLKEMNQKYGEGKTPVLITSNVSSLDKISEGVSLGVHGYFVKSNESLEGITGIIETVFKK